MIVETFLLLRKYSQLKQKRDEIKERYTAGEGSDQFDQAVGKIAGMMLVIIIVAAVLFVLSIVAMVDASRNCGDSKVLHILLLFFIPAYLPLYVILRLTGSICSLK
tara:strand:- start:142 stop:459 length:318 start_codon:yes stop_codon:yes gene_type:complete